MSLANAEVKVGFAVHAVGAGGLPGAPIAAASGEATQPIDV
jgi:hypothetical protein